MTGHAGKRLVPAILGVAALVAVSSTSAGATRGRTAPAPRNASGPLTIGNPPARLRPGGTFTVAVSAAGPPTFWLSHDRLRGRDDVRLGGKVTLRSHHGRAKLKLPKDVQQNVYFLLACVGKRCSASRKTGMVAGTRDGNLLPPAAPDPGGTPAETAQRLATDVLAGGRTGLAALRTALQGAGLGIVNVDGSEVQKPGAPAAGISVQAGELPLLARATTREQEYSLEELLTVLGTSLGNENADVAAGARAVVSDLVASASSDVPTLSFFAHFVDDLQPAASILASAGPDYRLNAFQLYLIAYWTAGAVHVLERPKSLGYLEHRSGLAARSSQAAAPSNATGPCQLDGRQQQIIEGSSYAFAQGSGTFRDWLAKTYEKVGTYNSVVGAYNTILSVVKLFTEGLALDARMSLDNGGAALVRTKDRNPGEKRVVDATVRFKFGFSTGTQYADCLKPVAAMLGLSIDGQNKGAVTGADVNWFVQGNGGAGGAGALDSPVEFYALAGNRSATQTRTNDKGEAHAGLEGAPQRVELPANPYPVLRRPIVGFTLTLHPNNLKSDFFGILGIGGPTPSSLVSAVTLALSHMGLYTYAYKVDVKDWVMGFKFQGLFYSEAFDLQNVYQAAQSISGFVCGNPYGDPWTIFDHFELTTPYPDQNKTEDISQRVVIGRAGIPTIWFPDWANYAGELEVVESGGMPAEMEMIVEPFPDAHTLTGVYSVPLQPLGQDDQGLCGS